MCAYLQKELMECDYDLPTKCEEPELIESQPDVSHLLDVKVSL